MHETSPGQVARLLPTRVKAGVIDFDRNAVFVGQQTFSAYADWRWKTINLLAAISSSDRPPIWNASKLAWLPIRPQKPYSGKIYGLTDRSTEPPHRRNHTLPFAHGP